MFYDSLILQSGSKYQIEPDEVTTLQKLAAEVSLGANEPGMESRKNLWTNHNDLELTYPLILVFPEGSWSELIRDEDLVCRSRSGREIELNLRKRLYSYKKIQDDSILDNRWVVRKVIQHSSWGLAPSWKHAPDHTGARGFDPILHTYDDLQKLKIPDVQYDQGLSELTYQLMGNLVGDWLEVSLEGVKHISYHLFEQYTAWRGLEQTMLDFYTDPQLVHDCMAFLVEAHSSILSQYQEQSLLSLNNDNTYTSTGGNGFTSQLPREGYDPKRIDPGDLWASAESQELHVASPDHHAEFALPYERKLLEPFGLIGYGCCEDLTKKLEAVKTIPGLRRISISPWAEVERCAEILGPDYIFSWKPIPACLVGTFNPDRIKDEIKAAVRVTQEHGCILEIILKDTHTCENKPERFQEWVRVAREAVREEVGDPPWIE